MQLMQVGAKGPTALKYQAELAKCPDQPCPRSGKFRQEDRAGCYRFLMGAVAMNDDFAPYPLTSQGERDGRRPTCEHWALSFFESLEAALEKWRVLNERIDANARYGWTHVGSIDLTTADGLLSPIAKQSGHMALHESASAPDFPPRVGQTVALPDPDPEDDTGVSGPHLKASRR